MAALAGCHRDSSSSPKPAPAAKARAPAAPPKGPSAEELTAGMVEAVTQGKSQTPVALKFDLLQRPTLGQPLEIAIALLPQTAASAAAIEVTGAEGLQLAEGGGRIDFPAVEAAQVYRGSIKLTPTAEGLSLLTLSVTLTRDQLAEARTFSVPILVAR
jgi:hypothetical protein